MPSKYDYVRDQPALTRGGLCAMVGASVVMIVLVLCVLALV